MNNGLTLAWLRTRIHLPGRLALTGLLAIPSVLLAVDFTYTINSDATITITGYTGPAGAVVIPAAIDGKPVTVIGDRAFEYNDYPDSATIANNVTNIGDYAFNSCPSLRRVVIGDRVGRIGNSAFYDCPYLTSVTLGQGATQIGDRAFQGCNRLVNLALGDRIAGIGSWAFWNCKMTTVYIPASVTDIGAHAFADCGDLYNVTLGAGITNIEEQAFANCLSLSDLYFHGNAPALGSYAFEGVYSATTYYLPGTTGWGPTFGGLPTVLWNTPIPAAPEGLSASKGTYVNKIQLTWTASSWATYYQVFRGITESATGAAQIGISYATTYDDTGADIGPTYYYRVKAVNGAGASAYSAPDSGRTRVEGPLITANGLVFEAYLNSGDTTTIAVAMLNMDAYLGANVDWWVLAFAHSGAWYYLDSARQWTPFDGNLDSCRPVAQGPLCNLTTTTVLDRYPLPGGNYDFWFAVDYPMDGILDTYGQIMFDQVTVAVQ